MARNGMVTCCICNKERAWFEGVCFCAYCGHEYPANVARIASQESKRKAFMGKWFFRVMVAWFFCTLLIPNLVWKFLKPITPKGMDFAQAIMLLLALIFLIVIPIAWLRAKKLYPKN